MFVVRKEKIFFVGAERNGIGIPMLLNFWRSNGSVGGCTEMVPSLVDVRPVEPKPIRML